MILFVESTIVPANLPARALPSGFAAPITFQFEALVVSLSDIDAQMYFYV